MIWKILCAVINVYRCKNCGNEYEVYQEDAHNAICPRCYSMDKRFVETYND